MLPEELIKKIRSIEVASRKLIQEGMGGHYMSAFRGSGMQFKEFRNYVYGDDVRHISWNVSARTQEPVIKLFEEDRERTLFLVVDVSASLRKGPWAQKKAERLAELGATLALSAAEAKDRFGLLLFSDRVESVIEPNKGKTHLLRVIREILAYSATGKRTSPDLALRQLDRVLKKKSIVFLLSDMEVLPSERVLRQTTATHELVAIKIEHPAEFNLPDFSGFMELQTAESGRPVTLDASSPSLRRYFDSYSQKRNEECEGVFKRGGTELLTFSTNEDFVPKLRSFFMRRSGLARRSGAQQRSGNFSE